MKKLTKKQILSMHDALVVQTGGSADLRDEGLLDSALSMPFQTFGGDDLYPTAFDKAVQLGFSLISNHPFVDGNKRIGVHAMLVMLELNGVSLSYEDEDIVQTVFAVAAGRMDADSWKKWVSAHIRQVHLPAERK